jgi:hypothetical protein
LNLLFDFLVTNFAFKLKRVPLRLGRNVNGLHKSGGAVYTFNPVGPQLERRLVSTPAELMK